MRFNEAGADAPEIPSAQHWCGSVWPGFNEAGADAPEIPNDGLRVLGDQFLDVREHNNASGRIGVDGSMDERGQSQRLAGTRGQNDQRVSVSRAEVVIQGVDAGLLVWAQYRLHATCANDP